MNNVYALISDLESTCVLVRDRPPQRCQYMDDIGKSDHWMSRLTNHNRVFQKANKKKIKLFSIIKVILFDLHKFKRLHFQFLIIHKTGCKQSLMRRQTWSSKCVAIYSNLVVNSSYHLWQFWYFVVWNISKYQSMHTQYRQYSCKTKRYLQFCTNLWVQLQIHTIK